MSIDLNAVVGNKLSDEGVTDITRGAVICANIRENLRQLIQAVDPAGYVEYRAIKYPGGEGTDTDETRIAATRFLFDRTRDLLVPHYVSMSK